MLTVMDEANIAANDPKPEPRPESSKLSPSTADGPPGLQTVALRHCGVVTSCLLSSPALTFLKEGVQGRVPGRFVFRHMH